MLGLYQVCIILLTYSVGRAQETPSQCEGQPTVWDLLFADPELSSVAALANQSITSSIWDASNANVTLFAPVDSAWKDVPPPSILPDAAAAGQAFPMYLSLEGRYTAEDLFAVPNVNSILGMLNGKDFVLSASSNTESQIIISSPRGDAAQVLQVQAACNGLLYKLNTVLLPFDLPATEKDLALYKNITSSVNNTEAITTIVENGYSGCTTSFSKAMASIPNSKSWMQVINSTGMLPALNNPLLSATVLVPLDQAAQVDGVTADSVMYNMLPGAYCPAELSNAPTRKNSMLGVVINRDQPLSFFSENGDLIVSGAFGTAKVVDTKIACNSVILVTDAPLYLPRPAVDAPDVLPTLPIRHLTCDMGMISPNGSGGGNNTSVNSSNSALAIGLGVGLGCAALLALLGGLLFIGHRHQNSSDGLGKCGVSSEGTASKSTPNSDFKEDSMEAGTSITAELTTPTTGTGTDNFSSLSSSSNSTAPTNSIFASLVSNPNATLRIDSSAQKIKQLESRLLGGRSGSSAADGAPRDLWEIDASDVQIVVDANGRPVELGKGSFGSVYRGTLRSVQPAAVKVLNANVGDDAQAAFEREASILKHVNRDKNVVQLYGTSKIPDGKLLLVTELMEGGDLRHALNDPITKESLAWHRSGKNVALDICRGLTALHAVRVVHRDLKSKNVLLTDTCTAKIGDVGIAAVHSQGFLTASAGSVIGTLAWSAPELILGERCTDKVDMYSFGIVLWEIATGEMPRRGFTAPPPPSERCPVELAELISDCTRVDAKTRPSAKEAYERLVAIPPL
ncbi:hypothetical protein Ndes2526A_g08695 [Nannochloris sp. 'desiccata']